MASIYYTYLWLREDGTPYYVGKGSGNRAFRKSSPPVGRILLQEHPSEQDAHEAEIFLIAYYGKKLDGGILNNRLDGGATPPSWAGRKRPNAVGNKWLVGNKARTGMAPTKTSFTKGHAGLLTHANSTSFKRGQVSLRKGITMSDEQKQKVSEGLKRYYATKLN